MSAPAKKVVLVTEAVKSMKTRAVMNLEQYPVGAPPNWSL